MKVVFAFISLIITIGCVHVMSPEEKEQYRIKEEKAQGSVSEWILENAMYPESYEAISFSEYTEFSRKNGDKNIPNSETYLIKHVHKILDKDSNATTFSGYFILDSDYTVNMIEKERSGSIGGALTPQTQIWVDQFGR